MTITRRIYIILLGIVVVAAIVTLVWSAGRPVQQTSPGKVAATQAASGWDPVGEFNASVDQIPESDRAIALFAQAFHRLRALDPWKDGRLRPGEDGWEDLRAWIDQGEVQQAFTELEEAARRPAFGMKLSSIEDPIWVRDPADPEAGVDSIDLGSPLIMDMLLPHLGIVRWTCGLLSADAMIALETDDRARFARSVRTRLGLIRLIKQPNTLISQIVQVAELERVREDIHDAMLAKPELIDEPMAKEIEQGLADMFENHLQRDMRWEQLTLEDGLRRMLDQSGAFEPHAPSRSWTPRRSRTSQPTHRRADIPVTSFEPHFREVVEQHERCSELAIKATQMPWKPMPEGFSDEMEAWEQDAPSIPGQIARRWFGILAPKWDLWALTIRTSNQNMIALRLLLAAHRHRLRHGDPALALADIDPDLMTFQPTDGFTGGPLQYRWTDTGPLIYALGADGDDDGGRHALDADGEPLQTISDDYLTSKPDGDWRLYPPPPPGG
jgi:hypothetical protein